MDITQEIKKFLNRHETTGWLILLMVGGFVLQGLILMVMAGLGMQDSFDVVINKLVLPYNLKDWLTQPWSIFTYPFFMPTFDILRLLVNGLILWAFGRIHQQLLGNVRTRRLVILAIPLIGLLTVTFSTVMNFVPIEGSAVEAAFSDPTPVPEADVETTEELTEGDTETTPAESNKKGIEIGIPSLLRVSGMIAIAMILIISSITLVPHYPIQLFLFGQVKIMWVGIILLVIELLWAGFLSPLGFAIAIAALFGYLHIYFLQKGTDITEVVWSYYQDSKPKPKMTVKYGEKNVPKKKQSGSTKTKSSSIDTKGGISQDVIDKILDKINAKGYESLSREEKELLFKASNQKDNEK